MLFVFLALYVALGIGCLVLGVMRATRSALVCGIVSLALAAASFAVWLLYSLGATHWTVSVLQLLLSPMPESILEPASLAAAGDGIGIPVIAIAVTELIVAVVLWAIPILGLVAASRAPRRSPVA